MTCILTFNREQLCQHLARTMLIMQVVYKEHLTKNEVLNPGNILSLLKQITIDNEKYWISDIVIASFRLENT